MLCRRGSWLLGWRCLGRNSINTQTFSHHVKLFTMPTDTYPCDWPIEDMAELDLFPLQNLCLTSSDTLGHVCRCLCIRSPLAGSLSFIYNGFPLLIHPIHHTNRWLLLAISPVSWKLDDMPRRGRPGLRMGGSVSRTTWMGVLSSEDSLRAIGRLWGLLDFLVGILTMLGVL